MTQFFYLKFWTSLNKKNKNGNKWGRNSLRVFKVGLNDLFQSWKNCYKLVELSLNTFGKFFSNWKIVTFDEHQISTTKLPNQNYEKLFFFKYFLLWCFMLDWWQPPACDQYQAWPVMELWSVKSLCSQLDNFYRFHANYIKNVSQVIHIHSLKHYFVVHVNGFGNNLC